MNKKKYIYFFHGSLKTHIGIYQSWFELARQGDFKEMEFLTVLNPKTFINQFNLIKHYKKITNLKIIINPIPIFKNLLVFLYFFYLSKKFDKVIVHLRKQSPKSLNLVKKVSTNLYYILEFEGDPKSEINYLKNHPFRGGFYNHIIKDMKKMIKKMPKLLEHADHILVVTNELKNLLIKRYPQLNLECKISSIPTGFDKNKFYYDPELRKKFRVKYNLLNKFVLVYTGNVYYSWQNLKRSLEIFKLLKNLKVYENMFFLLLTRKEDYQIAKFFIHQVGVSESDYLIKNVKYEKVNNYLNASDLGILLRDNHQMNKVSCPGKLGEYLASGLLVLTTNSIGRYSKALKQSNMGIILNNFHNDVSVIETIKNYKNNFTRIQRSKWAQENFSSQSFKWKYLNLLKKLGN